MIDPGLTPRSGTYALVLSSSATLQLQIGKLGTLPLVRGFYVYVGSAFGPGGLKARLGHHQCAPRQAHWHIDYLRRATRLEQVWFTYDPTYREHQWARLMGTAMRGIIPLEGFGASGCACRSHLYYFRDRPSAGRYAGLVRCYHPEHEDTHFLLVVQ